MNDNTKDNSELARLDDLIRSKQNEIEMYEEDLVSIYGENPYEYGTDGWVNFVKELLDSDGSKELEILRSELKELRWKRSSIGYPKHPYDILKGMVDELDEVISQVMDLRGKLRGVMNEFR